ncbi:MAG: hypothetical protein H7257_05770 [Taibaiella sp.]|nr:hypothetical protein [Taibaiella sp.]
MKWWQPKVILLKKPLPIVTIYLLGFKLADIDSPAIKVERKYIDMILGQPILNKSEFIEQLTHNSFIVQIPHIRGRLQNRLDALLSVFEQKHFLDESGSIKEYNHSIDFPEVRRILDVLHTEGVDPARRKEIEDEIEAWRLIEGGNRNDFERFRLQIEQKDRQIEQERAEKERILAAMEAQQKELEELKKLLGR